MKKFCLFYFFIWIGLSTFSDAQTPNWNWAKSAGGTTDDMGRSICTDFNGNIYITGYYQSPVLTIGSFSLLNHDTSGTTDDIFIAKYDPAGNVLWAHNAGGIYQDRSFSITFDNENIYITGYFQSPSILFSWKTLMNAKFYGGSSDMFLAKYDFSGNLIWAKRAGGNGYEGGASVRTDINGNPVVTGFFETQYFHLNGIILSNTGTGFSSDMFVAQYDKSGKIIWANNLGTIGDDGGAALGIDKDRNTYVAGLFGQHDLMVGKDTIKFNGGNGNDIFISKYDSSGNVIWAKGCGGMQADIVKEIVVTKNNLYMAGDFEGTAMYFGNDSISGTGWASVFIAKYDTAGHFIWAKSFGGLRNTICNSICTDANENIYITGFYNDSTLNFGNTTLTNVSSYILNDLYVVKMDSSGNILWAKGTGGNNRDEAYGVCMDENGNIAITGFFNSPVCPFDNVTLTNPAFSKEIFVAKLNSITGLPEYQATVKADIFPNPSQGQITISSSVNMDYIEITDLLGKVIYKDNPNNNFHTLTLYEDGIYVIRVLSKQEVITRKIIVYK